MRPTIQIGLCQIELKTREFWCGIQGNKVVLIDLAGAAHLVAVKPLSLVGLDRAVCKLTLVNGLFQ